MVHLRRRRKALASLIYERLKDPRSQIRVLTIQPGVDEAQIRCSLNTIELKQNSHACLSHCWGEQVATRRISVNGYHVRVRQNLYDFLHIARRLHYQSQIWIDAICINQDDAVEKSVQVELMSDIYTFASETFVWLGVSLSCLETIHNLAITLELPECKMRNYQGYSPRPAEGKASSLNWNCECIIRKIRENRYLSKNARLSLWGWASKLPAVESTLQLCYSAISAFQEVITAPYWARVWILQEITLSTNVQLLTPLGQLCLARLLAMHRIMSNVRDLYFALRGYDDDLYDPMTNSLPACSGTLEEFLRYSPASDYPAMQNLLDLLNIQARNKGIQPVDAFRATVRRRCTDPKDRVYAVRGLLDPRARVDVDYNKCKEEIFADVIQKSIHFDETQGARLCAGSVFEALEIDLPQADSLVKTEELLHAWPCHAPTKLYGWATFHDIAYHEAEVALYVRVSYPSTNKVILLEFRVEGKFAYPGKGRISMKLCRFWLPRDGSWTRGP